MSATGCTFARCGEPVVLRGLCGRHLADWITHDAPRGWSVPLVCAVDNCTRPIDLNGLCQMHRDRARRKGTPYRDTDRPPEPPDAAVPVALRLHLDDARRDGLGFDDAWVRALALTLGDLAPDDAEQWHHALTETMPAWASAYDRDHGGDRLAGFALLAA